MNRPPVTIWPRPRRQKLPTDNLSTKGRLILFGICAVLYAALALV